MTTPKIIDSAALRLLLEVASSIIDSGTTTSPIVAGGNSLSDSTRMWEPNIFINHLLRVTDTKSRREVVQILGNSNDSIITRQPWRLNFPPGSRYEVLSTNIMQALRDVFGGGANISAANPLEVHDPKVGSLISYEGTTTANGAGDGSTLICAGLATRPDYDGNLVIITSGACIGQARDINGITTAGTVTPASVFDAQIVTGVTFTVAGIRTVPAEVAVLTALVNTLVARLTAVRAGYLDELDFDLQGTLAVIAAYLDTEVAAILAAVDTEVAAIEAKLDVPANFMADISALALEATLNTHDTDIKALLAAIVGVTGVFHEQADVAVNITAVNGSETDVLHLSAASTRYIVRSLRLKCADPNPNTVTVRLKELVNDGLVDVDTFDITTANFATYYSLMDMFGLPHLAGDELQVTVRVSAGGAIAVTAQYSHAKTNV